MDLFGNMLYRCFQEQPNLGIQAEQLRPPLRDRFSRLPGMRHSKFSRNADRLMNRFHDYPRWLQRRAAGFDIFHLVDHSYSQLALELPAGRTVITCHDLDTFRCLLEPDVEPRPRWFRAMAQRTLRGLLRASQVITPSVFTQAALLKQGWFAPDRVSVIHPGVDPVFLSAPDPDAEQATAELIGHREQPYLLHVGSTIPRKRVDVLLQVFARISETFPEFRLMRVGGPLTEAQAEMAAKLGLACKIVQAPHLTKAELAAVYRNAALLLQTSDAEGFGLPVIEAMACGCPVVASDIPPLREAGGVAVEYCGVGEIDSWTRTVRQLLEERAGAPQAWEFRRSEARRHASGFTWSENVKQTSAVYARIFNGEEFGECR